MKKITPNDLAQFTGTEQHYFLPMFPAMKYTDGVKYFAERAGAYWFVEFVAMHYYPMSKREDFMVIEMRVASNMARIIVTDGDERQLAAKLIDFTDCPDGVWKFYMEGGVLLVPSEH
jgi:hypothetical protein